MPPDEIILDLEQTLHPMTDAFITRGKNTERHRLGEGHEKMEAEIRAMSPQTKKHLEPLEAQKGKVEFSSRNFRRSTALLTPCICHLPTLCYFVWHP